MPCSDSGPGRTRTPLRTVPSALRGTARVSRGALRARSRRAGTAKRCSTCRRTSGRPGVQHARKRSGAPLDHAICVEQHGLDLHGARHRTIVLRPRAGGADRQHPATGPCAPEGYRIQKRPGVRRSSGSDRAGPGGPSMPSDLQTRPTASGRRGSAATRPAAARQLGASAERTSRPSRRTTGIAKSNRSSCAQSSRSSRSCGSDDRDIRRPFRESRTRWRYGAASGAERCPPA